MLQKKQRRNRRFAGVVPGVGGDAADIECSVNSAGSEVLERERGGNTPLSWLGCYKRLPSEEQTGFFDTKGRIVASVARIKTKREAI